MEALVNHELLFVPTSGIFFSSFMVFGGWMQVGQAVMRLQKALPQARVVYCSATGASEPRNLGYMDRLGLWGPGTPSFSNFQVHTAPPSPTNNDMTRQHIVVNQLCYDDYAADDDFHQHTSSGSSLIRSEVQ